MDAKEKDDIFRNPPPPELTLGRHISTVADKNTLWAVVQAQQDKNTYILGCAVDLNSEEQQPAYFYHAEEGVHQPFLFQPSSATDKPAVVWNEFSAGKWHIKYTEIATANRCFATSETVFSSSALCLPPSATSFQSQPAIAWTAERNGVLTIHTAFRRNGEWEVEVPFAETETDCFRPFITASANNCVLFWDEYHKQRYIIAVSEFNNGEWRQQERFGEDNERWLNPKAVTAPNGDVYVTWTVLKDVIDKLGIVDHFPFAMAACWRNGQLDILRDENNQEDNRIIADLREGLLAKQIYKGHVGLRLNPRFCIEPDGDLQLVWERKIEKEGSDITSWLCGRKYRGGRQWSNPCNYSSSGYCYAVPVQLQKNGYIPTAFFNYKENKENILQSEVLKTVGTDFHFNADAWKRWHPYIPAVTTPPDRRTTVPVDGDELSLFWADTHCHSNFSPDAEGELDEIVNFAKNTAGLDAITVIDNDYYPHKALTPSEWRAQQDLAEHFTKDGHFVYMPGYEYTYHRSDLNPDFNHRCVIYPRKGGRLLRRIDPEANTDSNMLTQLCKTDGMAYPHHCSFKLIDQRKEWNVEVCSSWRVCIEETDFIINQLKAGWKFGFIGSSDTHRGVPGLGGARTGLFARELTPEALFEAYKQRRCIATQGFNIAVDFRVNDNFIGDCGMSSAVPWIKTQIRAPRELDYIEVIRDGQVVYWEAPRGTEYELMYRDNTCPAGEHFYFLKVKLIGDPAFNVDTRLPTDFLKPFTQASRYPHNLARAQGPFAWTSPIWITV
ncbi:MAG: DUF3604 domain-containing protein [Lentisphaeria bacterium]